MAPVSRVEGWRSADWGRDEEEELVGVRLWWGGGRAPSARSWSKTALGQLPFGQSTVWAEITERREERDNSPLPIQRIRVERGIKVVFLTNIR